MYSDAEEACSTFIDEAEANKQRIINRLEDELSEANELNEDLNAYNSELSDELAESKRKLKELQSAYDNANNRRNTSDSSNDNARRNDADVGKAVAKGDKYIATFYTAFCPTGCAGVTATGVDVSKTIYYKGKRVVAVDPSVIPLGSHVKVTLSNGETFEATAQDTGGDIKGKRIDILVASRDEAYRYGRQTVTVEIIK